MPEQITVPGRWGRIRRRLLWPVLGPEEMPEIRIVRPEVRRAFLAALESGTIRSRTRELDPAMVAIPDLSLNDYLQYCSVCYETVYDRKAEETDIAMYRAFSDGRHGGLLDLESGDPRAFRRWYFSNAHAGSHPFEIVRDRIVLRVHETDDRKYWLRLMSRRQFIELDLIRMGLALAGAHVPFVLDEADEHAQYAAGEDWVGVADESVWERGSPRWPDGRGILATTCSAIITSEIEHSPETVAQIEWFAEAAQVEPH